MLNFSVYKRKIVHTKISDFKKAGNQFKTKGSSAINAEEIWSTFDFSSYQINSYLKPIKVLDFAKICSLVIREYVYRK